jgi:putative oxygen-independent coproporphyrinogen III oxidase
MNSKGQTGLYIHWPFCLAKCPYCDFNVHVRENLEHERWEAAYLKSLEYYAEKLGKRRIDSVFFGGGTPSLMKPETVHNILDKVHALFPCANDLEVTLEANPTSIENQKFQDFREAGINRVSIGVQALNDADLQFLGRKHSAAEAKAALEIASSLFDRFSFDLIYARPEQSLAVWEQELKEAIALSKGHLSLYQLTIERSTPFYLDHAQKKFTMPDEDQSAAFYLLTQSITEQAGLPFYEVSNYAAAGHESKHNLIYWHYGDYIGIGPGAHGRLTMDGDKFSTRGHYAPDIWLERVGHSGEGAHPYQKLANEDRFLEALMMGLRLKEGVSIAHLEEQGGAPWTSFIDVGHFERARQEGWIDFSSEKLWLSTEGMLRLNALVPFILSAEPQGRAQPAG